MITELVKSLGRIETTEGKGICKAVLQMLSQLDTNKVKLSQLHHTACQGWLDQMHGVLH
jgi:hypothetical protein